MATLHVKIVTPTEIVLDEDVAHVTAEDGSGSLGIRPGHTALVTALVPGVVTARADGGREHFVAVNGGVMLVGKNVVDIVSRQAVAGESLGVLEETALAEFEKESAEDRTNHAAFEKMRIRFMRGVLDYDRAAVQ